MKSRSSLDKNRHSSGLSGTMKKAATEVMIGRNPSIIKILVMSDKWCFIGSLVNFTIASHPVRQRLPSSPVQRQVDRRKHQIAMHRSKRLPDDATLHSVCRIVSRGMLRQERNRPDAQVSFRYRNRSSRTDLTDTKKPSCSYEATEALNNSHQSPAGPSAMSFGCSSARTYIVMPQKNIMIASQTWGLRIFATTLQGTSRRE